MKVISMNMKVMGVSSTDPHADGFIYAFHGDGTYAQIDETHAHLNIPATFMYVPSLENDAIEITFNTREDLDWKIATQLKAPHYLL